MIPIDLSNKVAVITGGSGALGRVMGRTLAEAGADIAICYHRDQETAHLLRDEITAKNVRAAVVQADVTNQDSINAMRDAVVNTLGAADIIVNNAVIQYNWTSVLEQSPEDYESQFQSCVLHNVYRDQAFVPGMI
ncbi:MAG: SDR family NAD(P)-dependent oxidoreductase [Candidatus Poribacteria bacterium]|nr:SDR family NAD(P)-dependent oxidoreductase [Candidatus Poribacteria bacterium]